LSIKLAGRRNIPDKIWTAAYGCIKILSKNALFFLHEEKRLNEGVVMKTGKIARSRPGKPVAKGGTSVLREFPKRIRKKEKESIRLTVNGKPYELEIGNKPNETDPSHTLAHTLRETFGLTGTKVSCDNGACGCCTVLMDHKAVLSCMVLTVECDGKEITTIEGLKGPRAEKLDPLQQAFIDHTAFQCGFCTPGILMSAKALLHENPSPTEEDVKEALSGNFCRCISHYQVVKAVMAASREMR
jgi:aerobic-type carbon monoxide dehydrogenase small subunit (CoxS/CutS family)